MQIQPFHILRMELPGIIKLAVLSLACAVCFHLLRGSDLSLVYPSSDVANVSSEIQMVASAPKDMVETAAESPKPSMLNKSLPESIDLKVLLELQESGHALFVDARSRFYFRRGHIPKAINLPWNDFDGAYRRAKLQAATQEHVIVVYCGGKACTDSNVVASALRALGHQRVAIFTGGLQDWEKADLPLEGRQ